MTMLPGPCVARLGPLLPTLLLPLPLVPHHLLLLCPLRLRQLWVHQLQLACSRACCR